MILAYLFHTSTVGHVADNLGGTSYDFATHAPQTDNQTQCHFVTVIILCQASKYLKIVFLSFELELLCIFIVCHYMYM